MAQLRRYCLLHFGGQLKRQRHTQTLEQAGRRLLGLLGQRLRTALKARRRLAPSCLRERCKLQELRHRGIGGLLNRLLGLRRQGLDRLCKTLQKRFVLIDRIPKKSAQPYLQLLRREALGQILRAHPRWQGKNRV